MDSVCLRWSVPRYLREDISTMKRILALMLAALCIVGVFTGCSAKNESEEVDKGAEITVYLGDFPYDLDPTRAYFNSDMIKYYSLVFESLTTLDEKGKATSNGLASEWKYKLDERDGLMKLQIKLRDTSWSDGIAVSADDVIYTWKRLLAPENSNPAAALLFPIYNAKEAKQGLVTIDDVGFSSLNSKTVEVIFEEGFTDVEYFLQTLASPVFTPLRESYVSGHDDWAQPIETKKTREGEDAINTLVTNGPFTVKTYTTKNIVLERSTYYRNLGADQDFTKYVNPYRIIINFTKDINDQITSYENKEAFFVGDFSATGYESYKKKIDSTPAHAAYTYYFNANNELLSDARVRKALSIALDREEIAKIAQGAYEGAESDVVMAKAEAATGFVPTGVLGNGAGKSFRKQADKVIATSANIEEAKQLMKEAGVSSGRLTIKVQKDRVWESEVADYVASVWKELGIRATVETVLTKSTKNSVTSAFEEALTTGDFDVIGLDMTALSADALSVLAPFARDFSGSVVEVDDDAEPSAPHVTGFDNEEYNTLMSGILTAKNAKERFRIYESAEAILANEMPCAPLFFINNCTLTSGKLSKTEETFMGATSFINASLKNYKKYKVSLQVEE